MVNEELQRTLGKSASPAIPTGPTIDLTLLEQIGSGQEGIAFRDPVHSRVIKIFKDDAITFRHVAYFTSLVDSLREDGKQLPNSSFPAMEPVMTSRGPGIAMEFFQGESIGSLTYDTLKYQSGYTPEEIDVARHLNDRATLLINEIMKFTGQTLGAAVADLGSVSMMGGDAYILNIIAQGAPPKSVAEADAIPLVYFDPLPIAAAAAHIDREAGLLCAQEMLARCEPSGVVDYLQTRIANDKWTSWHRLKLETEVPSDERLLTFLLNGTYPKIKCSGILIPNQDWTINPKGTPSPLQNALRRTGVLKNTQCTVRLDWDPPAPGTPGCTIKIKVPWEAVLDENGKVPQVYSLFPKVMPSLVQSILGGQKEH